MLSDYKITGLEEKNHKIVEDYNRKLLYSDFVKFQEKGFLKFINYINNNIIKLTQEGSLSGSVELRARIKDTESALINNSSDKMLDDVFGMEIICSAEQDLLIIKQNLEQTLASTKSRKHEKENGYIAWHETYFVINDKAKELQLEELIGDDIPVVECQFKTRDVKSNPKSRHYKYKNINEQEVQKKLEKTELIIGENIPKMWISNNGEIKELSYSEIIEKVYPFVDISTIRIPKEKEI